MVTSHALDPRVTLSVLWPDNLLVSTFYFFIIYPFFYQMNLNTNPRKFDSNSKRKLDVGLRQCNCSDGTYVFMVVSAAIADQFTVS